MRSWPSNKLLRHPWSCPVLLVCVILVVYYPAVFSGIHPIDDPGILANYSTNYLLSNILLPGHSYYFRPIVELTFYFDNLLWGMELRTMHLENILLHCANSLLVYFLARSILVRRDNETLLIPLLAALLFALHPVNVEAVSWISGRTDPLLALFVLSSSCFWLNWLEKPRCRDIIAALLMFTAALLTKETALAFGVVAILFALTWPGAATERQRFKAIFIMIAPVLLLLMIALFFLSGTSGLGRFISGADLQLSRGIWDALIAFGFYVRKLIVPFPLNSAITSVYPMYGLLTVVLFPALWLLYRRYQIPGVILVSAVILIIPATLVAVKQITWTPFAERYLYLSTAFLALGFVGFAETWIRRYPVVLLTFIVLLLCGFGLGSYQRILLWNDKILFFQDAVAKSPEFGSVYFSLGGELMQKGQFDRAEIAFATADRLNQRASMRYPIKLAVMGVMLAKGEFLEARNYFFQVFKIKKDASADFLEQLYKADGMRLGFIDSKAKVLLAHDLLETLDLLNQKKPDPFWLYRSGQISLEIGDKSKAADFFSRSYSAAPVDAHYRSAAKTYLQKLERAK